MITLNRSLKITPKGEGAYLSTFFHVRGNIEKNQVSKLLIKFLSRALFASNPLQALRSFKLTITVDPKYHPKIIGRKGAIITNIRTEHDVNIQFPEKNDENQV